MDSETGHINKQRRLVMKPPLELFVSLIKLYQFIPMDFHLGHHHCRRLRFRFLRDFLHCPARFQSLPINDARLFHHVLQTLSRTKSVFWR